MIELSQETFDRIMAQKQMYDCLLIVGVQQWPGYDAARRMYEDMNSGRPTMRQCWMAQDLLQQQEVQR